MQRKPKGYLGQNHETIGSDILAVLHSLNLPHMVLGTKLTEQLEAIEPNAWYPISTLLDLMELLDKKMGANGLRKMGRILFQLSHEARVLEVAKSARDIIYGLDGMYHFANRGEQIGGWKVLDFRPGYALLEKTTPHHCAMEEGILGGALAAVGAPSTVTQPECFRKGAEACLFEIKSNLTDTHWTG
jgi:hypothetical protein